MEQFSLLCLRGTRACASELSRMGTGHQAAGRVRVSTMFYQPHSFAKNANEWATRPGKELRFQGDVPTQVLPTLAASATNESFPATLSASIRWAGPPHGRCHANDSGNSDPSL